MDIQHFKILETVPIGNLVMLSLELPANFDGGGTDFDRNGTTADNVISLEPYGIAEVYGANITLNTSSPGLIDYNNGSNAAMVILNRSIVVQRLENVPLSPHQETTNAIVNVANADNRLLLVSGSIPSRAKIHATDGNNPFKSNSESRLLAQINHVTTGNSNIGGTVSTTTKGFQNQNNINIKVGKVIFRHCIQIKSMVAIGGPQGTPSGVLTLIGRRG